jgi:hypothetical protein
MLLQKEEEEKKEIILPKNDFLNVLIGSRENTTEKGSELRGDTQ